MDRLLEILGRGITVDTADLIYHWLTVVAEQEDQDSANCRQLNSIVKLIGEQKIETAQGNTKLYLFENPNCPRGRLTSALINLKNADVQAAVEDLRVVFEFQPNNTIALYGLGHCCERLGQEEKAIEFYQDCIKFKGYLQLPRQRLAAIYFRNFQLEKALEQYESLRDEYPDDISTLVTLGYLYNNLGKYDKAVEIFNIAILMHPDNFLDGDNDVIEQLIAEGQLHHAVEKIDLLLDKYPERAELAVKKADILCMRGDIDDAIEQYEKAVETR